MDTNTEQTNHTAHTLGIEPGDFFVAAWGYGQTNIDYWHVVSVTASGQSVRVQRCQTEIFEIGEPSDSVYPGEPTGEIKTKRLSFYQYNEDAPVVAHFKDGRGVGMPMPKWAGPGIFPTNRQTNWAFGH